MANHLVIMAGGSGTRFWPKSTSLKPKQLLRFGRDPDTLIVQTLKRFNEITSPQTRWIVTTEKLQAQVGKEVGLEARVLAEPQARNTAPCIYWAAKEIERVDPSGVMMVMPADHVILRLKDFKETVAQALAFAQTGEHLITLGVQPSRPETGYGYLRTGDALGSGSAKKVDAFVEKPSLEKADSFLKSGNYLWNGGMFLWKVSAILKAFDEHMPEMKRAWEQSQGDVARAYPLMTATSIDFGVMEKARNVVTFPLDCGWDDVGSWISLEGLSDFLGARVEGNTVTQGTPVLVESSGNIVDTPGKLVALLGVNDLIVVETDRALLVAHKSRAQDIKKIVDLVKSKAPDLA